jgi:putative pyruvate formate lyase activating enzyme
MPNFLSHYQRILTNEEPPNYLKTKNISASFSKKDPIETLWEKHAYALNKANQREHSSDQSLLDLKIEITTRIFSQCHLCEHRCNVDRTHKSGHCNVTTSRIASEFIHQSEESIIVPSHTIFFSGCSFQCVFCQNWDISQFRAGIRIPEEQLANRIHIRKQQGSRNVNWVGGEPTPNILYILKTLKQLDDHIPQIWNSNMYCSIETLLLLDGIIDVYLADYKFGNDNCSFKLCGCKTYTSTIQRNITHASKQADLLIRHLIVPNHISCCSLPVLHWIHEFLPHVPINIMDQYRPCYHARNHPLINRCITSQEYEKVITTAKNLHVTII